MVAFNVSTKWTKTLTNGKVCTIRDNVNSLETQTTDWIENETGFSFIWYDLVCITLEHEDKLNITAGVNIFFIEIV